MWISLTNSVFGMTSRSRSSTQQSSFHAMSDPKPPNILLYGAGSCGAIFLYQLLQANCTVTAVCRSNYASVKTHGFTLLSVRYGNVSFKPTHVVRDLSECVDEKFDYILVCTKSFPEAKPSLAEQLRPVVKDNTDVAIVLAQNGVMIEEEIAVAYPTNPVLSGVVYVSIIASNQVPIMKKFVRPAI
jgi:2-dehydropantoate 2-reductase